VYSTSTLHGIKNLKFFRSNNPAHSDSVKNAHLHPRRF